MKIAFDYQIFSNQYYGGISRYYSVLADELLKLNQDVKIFAGFHVNNYLKDLPLDVVKGIRLKRYPYKTGKLFQVFNHGINQFQIVNSNIDILHETYYSNFPLLKTDKIRIATAYDMINEIFSESFLNSIVIREKKKSTFSRVDQIISISKSTKNDLVNLFDIAEEKVSVVHLGVDIEKFRIPRNKSILRNKPFLLHVGARKGYKNFNKLVLAYSSSPRLKADFDLIAFGSSPFSKEELDFFKSCQLSSEKIIHLHGDDNVLCDLYSQAAALVYPSLYEGFGLPPLEAMASGCPVISSNSSSLPEVVGNAGEFFDPNDVDSIREAIENVVYLPSFSNELVLLGYENLKKFSWQKCASETLNIYRNFL